MLHHPRNFSSAEDHRENVSKPAQQLDCQAIFKTYHKKRKKLPSGNFLENKLKINEHMLFHGEQVFSVPRTRVTPMLRKSSVKPP